MSDGTTRRGLCTITACGRPRCARGWCASHYKRWRVHGAVRADVPLRSARVVGGHRICGTCEAPFVMRDGQHRYCSTFCRSTASNASCRPDPAQKTCRSCGRRQGVGAFRLGHRCCIECEDLRAQGLKRCLRCEQVKSRATDFHTRRNQDGHEPQCKACSSENSRRYNARPEIRLRVRERHLKTRFNITAAQYDELLAGQGGVCAICKREPNGKSLHVDHDHGCCSSELTCGKCIRGLLCYACNSGLGAFRESVAIAEKAVTYLRRFE